MAMERTDSSAAIQSLLSAYSDEPTGDISGSDDELHETAPEKKDENQAAKVPKDADIGGPTQAKVRKLNRLVSYGPDADDDLDNHAEEQSSSEEEEHGLDLNSGDEENVPEINSSLNVEMASSLSRSVMNMAAHDVQLPPQPPGKPSKKVQEKIQSLFDKMKRTGNNMNTSIQWRKDFRNPSIYEKLIEFIGIDDKGTNFPPNLYNPSIWGSGSYFDDLAGLQKKEMDKREKERKDRTKIDFMVGTKKTDGSTSVVEQKRKTKWDTQPSGVVAAGVNKTIGKPTVISAVGTIKKPKH